MINSVNKVSISPSKIGEGGSLLLDVPLGLIKIPEWLSNSNMIVGYKAKDEYHVTVIGLDIASTIQDCGKTDEVKSLFESFTWTIEISNQYVELAKDDESGIHRQSVICIVKVPELIQFYDKLTKIVGISFNIPPAHVTLYTKNYDRGIGLYTENDLYRFKVRDLSKSSELIY